MAHQQVVTQKDRHFRVASVERTEVPEGAGPIQWCRYVIENGCASIIGFRPGSLQDVKAHAEQVVAKLNERNSGTHAGWGTWPRKS